MLHIFNDMNHYHKAYGYYRSKTNRLERVKEWTDTIYESNVVNKLTKSLSRKTVIGQQIRVLGIGSGDGKLEIHQLQKLAATFPKTSVCVVEPSELITEYKDTVGSNPIADSIKHGTTTTIPVHRNLKDDKAININVVNSSQVKAILDQLQIAYTQSMHTETIDITDFMDNSSSEGDILLDLLTFTVDFKKSAPDDVLDRVMRHFQQHSRILNNGNGIEKIFCETSSDIFLITREDK
ncbi:histamine N-methyltransferase-like [Amphiura filiformis]|uniref:histamine N-methyltransferase-like n=1 Tax=Amphiura filiformis TaxID=82378 RepID=UPI003B21EEB6